MLDNTNNYKKKLDKLQKLSEKISDLIYNKEHNEIDVFDQERRDIIRSLHFDMKDKDFLNCLKNIKAENDNMISMLNKNKKSAYNDHIINIKRLNAYKKI